MLKKLPAGESSFPAIREGDWLYVDKTEPIYHLASTGKYFFLSRPSRFGKSLTASTLKTLFEGRRELFKGLWIYEHSDWDWSRKYPVISLSFNAIDYKTNGLEKALSPELARLAQFHGVQPNGLSAKDKFRELILALGKDAPVVVLVGEYD